MIPLLNVSPPDDFMGYYGNLMTILNFEIYNAGSDISEAIELPSADPPEILIDKLNLLGMESANFIENDGNFIFFYSLLVLGVVQIFSTYLFLYEVTQCKKWAKQLR